MNMQTLSRRSVRVTLALALAVALGGARMAVPATAHILSAPTFGGTLAVGNAQPDCLDPQKTGAAASNLINSQVLDTLVSFDQKGHYVADLALKWKYSGGNKILTLYLRHGVRFSNGDPFTASAVKYTFERGLNPTTKSPLTASELKGIVGIKVVDPYTVRLTLSAPSRVLLTNFTAGFVGILDPKTASSTTCEKVIGTGPFKIQSVGPAFSTVTLVRNDFHNWNPSWIHNRGRAYLSKVVFKYTASSSTAVSELLTGDLDYSTIPGTELSRVQGNTKIKLYRTLAQGVVFMGFNLAHAPLQTTAVRQAMAQAIDKKAILTAAYQNLGIVATSPVSKTQPYFDKNSSKYVLKYNPSAAQRTLAANHVTGPFDLVIIQNPQFQAAAELIQAELGAVGVKVNIVVKTPADYFPAVATGKFDLTVLGVGYPDPDILYQLFDSSQLHGGLNLWGYNNPTADSLLTTGRESSKKARAAYAQIQKMFDTQAVMVPLVTTATPFGLRSRVQGYQAVTSLGFPFPFQSLYIQGK